MTCSRLSGRQQTISSWNISQRQVCDGNLTHRKQDSLVKRTAGIDTNGTWGVSRKTNSNKNTERSRRLCPVYKNKRRKTSRAGSNSHCTTADVRYNRLSEPMLKRYCTKSIHIRLSNNNIRVWWLPEAWMLSLEDVSSSWLGMRWAPPST